jgi:hypothetical protein
MKINKEKCGIMIYSNTYNKLTKWEKKKTIKDIPIVENYKYLGVELNK